MANPPDSFRVDISGSLHYRVIFRIQRGSRVDEQCLMSADVLDNKLMNVTVHDNETGLDYRVDNVGFLLKLLTQIYEYPEAFKMLFDNLNEDGLLDNA